MVQLFEKYRIVYLSRHQFLGDLFEQLLNKDFKQNEGQFFTPIPITRFTWDSLPVERMVKSKRGVVYPKVIDYACGAGHFLTEAIEAINYFVNSGENNYWAKEQHIYPNDIKLIPVPDINNKLKSTIVNKCAKIEKEYNTTRTSIENYRQKT